MSVEHTLQQHYTHGALESAINDSLRKLGKDPGALHADDLAPIDEFHIGGRPATMALLAQCAFKPGMQILDIGSGLGGPARVCATTTGAHVHGIDLTPEYVAIAASLSARVALSSSTTFSEGSALALPFARDHFDGAYMIHVAMNIADKAALFRDIRRTMKHGSTFGIYDIMRLSEGPLAFPLPWSSVAETSFVEMPDDYRAALTASGFDVVTARDRFDIARAAFTRRDPSAPELTHRGPGFALKSKNLAALVNAGILCPYEIIARAL
jgi:SAM-dependent methyltransferase